MYSHHTERPVGCLPSGCIHVSHTTTTDTAKKKRSENSNTSGEREAVTTTTVSLHDVEVSPTGALLLCKSKVRLTKLIDAGAVIDIDLSWLIKIFKRSCDLSCFPLQSNANAISLIYL